MALRVTLALVLLLCVPWPAGATAGHAVTTAALVMTPQSPRVGEPWRLSVSLTSADPSQHPGRKVRAVADMTGHRMRPIVTELVLTPDGSGYEGTMAFTMRGPWKVTLSVQDLNDVLTADYFIGVVGSDASTGMWEMRALLDLHRPVHPNIIPPWWTVAGTVALILAMQAIAAVYQRRRRLSASPAAPQTPASSGSPRLSSPA